MPRRRSSRHIVSLDRVVIVGGSIAALTAVATLRIEDFDGHITVLTDEDLPPYTRVPLSKSVLAGRESLGDIVLAPLADEVDLRLRTGATGLDVDERLVHTAAGGRVPYDGLIIASGARARRVGRPDQTELVLRTHEDCTRLRKSLDAVQSVLIVGGGFLGMEIASTCIQLGKQVTVVDLARPLDRLLGPVVAQHVRDRAERAGVRLQVAPGGVRLLGSPTPTGVETTTGLRFAADLVVSAVGDIPNTEWLVGSGIPISSGVVVDDHCRVSPQIVAAGDVTVMARNDGGLLRMPSWTNAIEQGRAAALSLLHADDAPLYRPSQYFWTEQFDLDIKVVGQLEPQGPPAVLDGSLESGPALLAWPTAANPHTVIAVDHHTPPAKLKRLLHKPSVLASA